MPARNNPLLESWTGPYGGVPPFDRVKVEDFEPALEAAMQENLAEIERIASNPQPPTFENTIAAQERAGRTMTQVAVVYSVWGGNMATPEFQAVEREMAPRLAEFSDRIVQNAALFKRIEAVYNSPAKAQLTPEQQRLVWLYYTTFVRAGAQLDAGAKERVAEINKTLAALFTQFSQNVLADETNLYLLLENERDLDGLPGSVIEGAAAKAEELGHDGKWVIANTRSAMEPFLTFATRRDLREKAWRLFMSRGDTGGESDNKAIVSEVL